MASKNARGETYGKGRTRNFATIVYPDSAPEKWQSILAEQCIPAFISPLHKDLNPDDSEKKPHYHVMLMFESMKTDEQAKDVFDKINGVGLTRVQSLRGYARYLTHMDDPSKKQYSAEDVISMCGADYSIAIGLPTDKYKAIGEMIDWCIEYGVVSYSELIVYARENKFDWFRVLCDSGTVVITQFLKSQHWTETQYKPSPKYVNTEHITLAEGEEVDPYTGEIIKKTE